MNAYKVMTPRERETFIQRQQIASLMLAGATYKDIEKQTGASTGTIALVSRLLKGEARWKS